MSNPVGAPSSSDAPKNNSATVAYVDLASLLDTSGMADGVIWSSAPSQLNVNLVHLSLGETIPPHINEEVDVLIVALAGEGTLAINDEPYTLDAGVVALIPRGAERWIRCEDGPLVYLTAHRARNGLMPS
ncbi:MAG: cupin domain-containing protein [Anaerolineales bacterium]|nr:cupin domain-containing protein [Anaerolineales bacterium]MCB9127288.1 cupin domain-containing protein [Ardenticatenales bacterium]MCB9172577.1 cupin domain-containing protein [Ardenticatenales bacterium]